MPEGAAAAEFAELLRELKDRSGLSYGVLAKRLHMSTSTLHRYCNGDAVPTDYAPVERLARLCKAAPEDLVELHRRWVLADAARGRKGVGVVPEGVPPEAASPVVAPSVTAPQEALSEDEVPPVVGPVAEDPMPARRRPRTALLAAVAAAAVLGAVALAVNLPSGGTDDGRERAVGAAARESEGRAPSSASPSVVSPSVSATEGTRKDKAGKQQEATPSSASGAAGASTAGDDSGAVAPLTVAVAPYTWESPCSQRYLIDKPPTKVSPPPLEQDATAWVAAAGAVASGEQYVTLTVQGTGADTVVVEGLTVRMAGKRPPLAWNDYAMGYPGVGCGSGVPTRSFTVALDAARPAVLPEAGHRNFPFKVSESDPEVYYIRADASAYDVSWYLELTWSSGSRHGTLTVDDKGRPFRTSGNNGRPAYEFPLGGSQWVRAGESEGS